MSSEAPRIVMDGYVLNDYYSISDIRRPWPSMRRETDELAGRDGTLLRGTRLEERPVSFRLWAFSPDHERLMDAFGWLVEMLTEPGTHELAFSDEGGNVRTVTLDGELTYDEYEEKACMTVNLVMHDPYRDSTAGRNLVVPSGGSVSFAVRHRNPRVLLTASQAVRNASTGLWGITIDGQTHLRVAPSVATEVSVSIDCQARKVLVAGATSMIDLGSDWPQLARGTHTVQMTQGTGAATLTIRERCL